MPSLSSLDFVPAQACSHELLVANGLGDYASSTAIGMNSRKYHGLLVAPLKGTASRHVMLSKLEETVAVGRGNHSLSTNAYSGAIFPAGFQNQRSFSFLGHPVFTYNCGGAKIEKSVRMVHGKNTTVASYRLLSGPEASLSIRPLLSPRGIHGDPSPIQTDVPFASQEKGFSINSPAEMSVTSNQGLFTRSPDFYYGMQYAEEQQRGFPCSETLYSPGVFTAKLSRDSELHICASLESLAPHDALDLLDSQALRLPHHCEALAKENGFSRTDFSDALVRAADSFLVSSGSRKGIIAGYHWFSEWGRDAMISLPGLLLCTGRHSFAREVLLSYASAMEGGLLPNFVDEYGEAHYNSADSSLWFANAVREYADATWDSGFIRKSLYAPLRTILENFIEGTKLVEMGKDCLLCTLEPGATWMDARVGGAPVTLRKGKPVEINALWNSYLHFMLALARHFNDEKTQAAIQPILEELPHSFQKYLSAEGHLFDLLEPNDAALRPNQLFALSLPHSPLNPLQQRHIFNIVRSKLYTPLGLRTLAPDDPRFHATYSGGPSERDSAYHQGAIWPWLLGAFYDAQLRVYPGSEPSVLSALRPFSEAMREGCMGTLPELYEPATMRPCGAVSQAWSVAEILRIYAKVKRKGGEERRGASALEQPPSLARFA